MSGGFRSTVEIHVTENLSVKLESTVDGMDQLIVKAVAICKRLHDTDWE